MLTTQKVNTCLIFVIIFFDVASVSDQLEIPGCPSLYYQSPESLNNLAIRHENSPCFCDNATDVSGGDDSIVINCIYPTELNTVGEYLKNVSNAHLSVYELSINGLILNETDNGVDFVDNYFKNLNVSLDHLSIKTCINQTKPLIFGEHFFDGLQDTLVSLTVYNCRLQKVPSNLRTLKNLQSLRLQSVSIDKLNDNDFIGLENLLAIDLQGNNMTEIGRLTFSQMTNLQSLILGPDNNLNESIFPCFANLNNLLTLDLSGNQIFKLNGKPFLPLQQLRSLFLNNNFIAKIERDTFENLTDLIELNLIRNLIDNVETGSFSPLKQLQELSLRDNFLSDIRAETYDLPKLDKLDLSNNEFSTLTNGAFKNLPVLKKLQLSYNKKLTRLDPVAFQGLAELETLELSGCNITELANPDTFSPTVNLLKFALGGNPLLSLSADIFKHLKYVITLNLQSTGLPTVPVGLFDEMKNLRHLTLDNNQWVCNKDIAYLVTWLQRNQTNEESASQFKYDRVPVCYEPETMRRLPLRAVNIDQLI